MKRVIVSDTTYLDGAMWGGPLRVFNVYSNLSEDYKVNYIGLNTKFKSKKSDKELTPSLREILIPITKIYFPIKFIETKVFKHLTFDLFTYIGLRYDYNFKKELNDNHADILIASHPWTFPCFDKKNNQKLIYDAHNCEYLLIKKILNKDSGCILDIVKKIEKEACDKSEIIFVCSEEDRKSFMELYNVNPKKIYLIPNGTEIPKLINNKEKVMLKNKFKLRDNAAIFIGAYYNPNIEASEFIIKEIAPKLKDIDFIIAGSIIHHFKDKEIPDNVKLFETENRQKVRELLFASDIMVNPMSSGSGMHLKMVEAMAFGLPIISTKLGARGLNVKDEKELIICDLIGFNENIEKLFSDMKLYNNLRKNALVYVKSYDWKKIGLEVSNILDNLK